MTPDDLPPAARAELETLRAQRNREADAVAHLNGLLAESGAEVARLAAEVTRLRAALESAQVELDVIRRVADDSE